MRTPITVQLRYSRELWQCLRDSVSRAHGPHYSTECTRVGPHSRHSSHTVTDAAAGTRQNSGQKLWRREGSRGVGARTHTQHTKTSRTGRDSPERRTVLTHHAVRCRARRHAMVSLQVLLLPHRGREPYMYPRPLASTSYPRHATHHGKARINAAPIHIHIHAHGYT